MTIPEIPTPPEWLSPEAREIWDKKLTELGSPLPADLDLQILAKFCDQVARYAANSQKPIRTSVDHRALLSLGKAILISSDKLGFNPRARAQKRRNR